MSDSEAEEPRRLLVKATSSPRWAFFDFLLRLSVMLLAVRYPLDGWLYWASQGAVSVLLLALLFTYRDPSARVRKLLGKGAANVPFNVDKRRSTSLPLLALLLATVVGVALHHAPPAVAIDSKPLATAIALAYFIWLIVIGSAGPVKRLDNVDEVERYKTENALLSRSQRALASSEHTELADIVEHHESQAIALEANYTAINDRVDDYGLESTLFGALSFTAFVAIMASDKPLQAYKDTLIAFLGALPSALVSGSPSGIEQAIGAGPGHAPAASITYALVTVETLICAMLFLAVVVGRIVYINVREHVSRQLKEHLSFVKQAVDVYNAYAVANGNRTNQLAVYRITRLCARADSAHSVHSLKNLEAITSYMKYFRNLGVIFFVLILVTSAATISMSLSLFFVAFYVVSAIYLRLDSSIRIVKLAKAARSMRPAFLKRGAHKRAKA